MADSYPYVPAPGGLEKTISQFRNSFPSVVDSGTLKKFGLAPNNERYVLNVFRFLKFIDADGKKTDLAAKIFLIHEDEVFSKEFSSAVRNAYSGLFGLYGEGAWATPRERLITYFRQSDQKSATVGGRQASTFQLLARLSGHGESHGRRSQKSKAKETPSVRKKQKNTATTLPNASESTQASPPVMDAASPKVGLTVRIEINLPAVNDQGTYDKIFKSIRDYLLK